MTRPHLLVALTAHGYGHAGQTAPVINELRRRMPMLRLTLYSALPKTFLTNRFEGEFEHIDQAPDVGMLMKHALEVDDAASAQAYQAFHRNWRQAVSAETELLKKLSPHAVLANVPYRPLAAAAASHIPALALCSLNWADIYRHFCGESPNANIIIDQMLDAYRSARAFLQPSPSMPMPELDNRMAIGPVARLGSDRRQEILRLLNLEASARLILVSLGGVPAQIDLRQWPHINGVCWIVPAAWHPQRADTIAFESLAMNFVDVLRSVDALLTKPGYGSFAEAACNGIPVLYVPRHDWPEEVYLTTWLQEQGRCRAIERAQLQCGDFAADLEALLALPRPSPIIPTGVDEAVEQILALL